eukprot:CAMPEP_0113912720 /NCGR_PEP_ID=MMETSP0780_2-20120614/29103_1 /TAXON_ID=652834 /ORGANISM="Palpitomonas bilix" /LENGTH=558 /DNA_ID=CAMNT_0000909749 /DNA_START=124 /DNA_END=1800 /DNA_ORIENTATION=- /assembly_acc=CAM_ASM_000599
MSADVSRDVAKELTRREFAETISAVANCVKTVHNIPVTESPLEVLKMKFEYFSDEERQLMRSMLGGDGTLESLYRPITVYLEVFCNLQRERFNYPELVNTRDSLLLERWTFRVAESPERTNGFVTSAEFKTAEEGLVRAAIATGVLLPTRQLAHRVQASARIVTENLAKFSDSISKEPTKRTVGSLQGDTDSLEISVEYLGRDLLVYKQVDIDAIPYVASDQSRHSKAQAAEEARKQKQLEQAREKAKVTGTASRVPSGLSAQLADATVAPTETTTRRASRRSSDDGDRESNRESNSVKSPTLPVGTPPVHYGSFKKSSSGRKTVNMTNRTDLSGSQPRSFTRSSILDGFHAGSPPQVGSLPIQTTTDFLGTRNSPPSGIDWSKPPMRVNTTKAFKDASVYDARVHGSGSSSHRSAGPSLPDVGVTLRLLSDHNTEGLSTNLPMPPSMEFQKLVAEEQSKAQASAVPNADTLHQPADTFFMSDEASIDISLRDSTDSRAEQAPSRSSMYCILSSNERQVASLVADSTRFRRLISAARKFMDEKGELKGGRGGPPPGLP